MKQIWWMSTYDNSYWFDFWNNKNINAMSICYWESADTKFCQTTSLFFQVQMRWYLVYKTSYTLIT